MITTILQPCLEPFLQDKPKNFEALVRVDQKALLLEWMGQHPDCTSPAIRKATGITEYNLYYFLRTMLEAKPPQISRTRLAEKPHGDLSTFTYRVITNEPATPN